MKDKKIALKVNEEEITAKEIEYLIQNTRANSKINPKVHREQFIEGIIATELLVQYAKRKKMHEDEEFKMAMKFFEKETLAKIVIQDEMQKIASSGEIKVSEEEIEEYLKKDPTLIGQCATVLSAQLKNIKEDEREAYLNEETRKYVRNLLEKMKMGMKQGEFIKRLRSQANVEYK